MDPHQTPGDSSHYLLIPDRWRSRFAIASLDDHLTIPKRSQCMFKSLADIRRMATVVNLLPPKVTPFHIGTRNKAVLRAYSLVGFLQEGLFLTLISEAGTLRG